ncbi:hypothetical protein F0L74_22855 [Chitinophaga agrisoli]|uniref:Uncharacterized protein n=1 Tax=Chitinophaga agrisoli TaxID=2607653 RepID=A0A5B2VJJ1_9BACT|nr:hypothetical protein [Chitinophaga agrisoli]KAA2239054.1 hypothetical protein F0L74_22855 [Chitinophaga agrisoli]
MAHDPKNAVPIPTTSRAVAHNQQSSGIARATVAPVPQLKTTSQEGEAPVQQVTAPRADIGIFTPPQEPGPAMQAIPPFQLKIEREDPPAGQSAAGQSLGGQPLAEQAAGAQPAGSLLPHADIIAASFNMPSARSAGPGAAEMGGLAYGGAAVNYIPTAAGTALPYDGWPVAQRKQARVPSNAPVQRQVIQLQWDIDEELGKLDAEKIKAVGKINANQYEEAWADYQAARLIMADIAGRHRDGADKIYNGHMIKATASMRAIIDGYNASLKGKMDTMLAYYKDMYITYDAEYTALYDQIAAKLQAKADGEVAPLKEELDRKAAAQKNAYALHSGIYNTINKFKTKVAGDTDISYNYGKKKADTGEIGNTKLAPVSFEALDGYLTKNKGLATKYTNQGGEIKKTTDAPDDDTQRNSTVVLLMAGSKARKEAVTALFTDDVPKQISIFTQLNKHHRSDDITDAVALITAAGTDNLAHTLGLIDAVGAKGDIKAIKAFYDGAKTVTGTPGPMAMAAFLVAITYTAIKDITDFVKEAGKYGNLDAIKPVYAAAKTNNKVESVTELLKAGGIPGTYATDAVKIGLAFATTKGKSKAADYTKLLSVTGWDKAKLLALVMECAENDGNVTAERWAVVAQKEPLLQDKPEEVRATARLNSFANEDWYKDHKPAKLSSTKKAKKKYTQLLYALMGKEDLTGLGNISFDNIQGDFLSMLVFFHKHIASFNAQGGRGFDREGRGGGLYARSSTDHALNEQYTSLLGSNGVDVSSLLQPINPALLALQDKGATSKNRRAPTTRTFGGGATSYTTGDISVASAGLPSHNLRVLEDQQGIIGSIGGAPNKKAAKEKLFDAPEHDVAPDLSRTVGEKAATTDSLLEKQKTALAGKITTHADYGNFHDGFLEDRGQLVTRISNVINSISGGAQTLEAIGSEGHPSLILKVPKSGGGKFIYDGVTTTYNRTKPLIPGMVTDFNLASDQEVKITERGSFGFQRPTLADTGDSVRLWPGYTPVEALRNGLKVLVEKLSSKDKRPSARALTNIGQIDALTTDNTKPVAYVEALKTAMRHAFIALEKKIAGGAPAEKKRVSEWLRTRILIKLQQSGILLDKATGLYKVGSKDTQQEKNKHFLITTDMTDKLQEYTMLYTAATLEATTNPNKDHDRAGKFKNDDDVYEKKVVSKLGATDYRMFYLDSGEQALIVAGLLANRFTQGKDHAETNVPASPYISRNPYFEIGVFNGDSRSNLRQVDSGAKIVHGDLSPVITQDASEPKPRAEIDAGISRTWQDVDGNVEHDDVIPILDITNSSIDAVNNLGDMPKNFIIVESLTKHEQLGADKFIMGRLIAVSNTKGTTAGALKKTNFLDLAQNVVGPVANKAYNPLLAQIRANMDKALYSDDLA